MSLGPNNPEQPASPDAPSASSANKLKVLDLFSGIGGFSLGLERTGGFQTVAFCEINPHVTPILREKWPNVPIYEDVREITRDRLARDKIYPDFIAAGFPCQDISIANTSALGLVGSRSGLFWEVVRIISEFRPTGILLENVAALLDRGFGEVLGSLAALGYDAEWHCIPSSAIGANHRRDRLWIVAHPGNPGREGPKPLASALIGQIEALAVNGDAFADGRRALGGDFSGLRAVDGISIGMERRRISALGNSVVPQIPELIGRAILSAERATA